MDEKVISLAVAFTPHPGPRKKRQGPFSGEAFRGVLVDALAKHDRILVDLDGTSGIGSSFLDEAFGGLIEHEGFSREDVQRRVRVKSDADMTYLLEVQEAVALAEPAKEYA